MTPSGHCVDLRALAVGIERQAARGVVDSDAAGTDVTAQWRSELARPLPKSTARTWSWSRILKP